MIRFALALAICLPACLAPPALAQAPAATTAPLAQFDHISIRDEGGTGPAVILIPGLASPRAVYADVVPQLTAKHRVFTVQVNGFAGEDLRGNLKPGVLDGIVAELDSFVRDRTLGAPAVVGHSLGGLVGMMLAARHPARVGRLMVVDTLPFIGPIFVPGATPATLAPQAAMARAATAAAYGKPQPVITTDPGGIWSIRPEGRIKVANWSRLADPRAVAQALYEDMTTDVGPELAKVAACPFTVLYATGAGPQATALWQAGYAGTAAKLVPVADSWHFIMLDQPAVFAKALTDFLAAAGCTNPAR